MGQSRIVTETLKTYLYIFIFQIVFSNVLSTLLISCLLLFFMRNLRIMAIGRVEN